MMEAYGKPYWSRNVPTIILAQIMKQNTMLCSIPMNIHIPGGAGCSEGGPKLGGEGARGLEG